MQLELKVFRAIRGHQVGQVDKGSLVVLVPQELQDLEELLEIRVGLACPDFKVLPVKLDFLVLLAQLEQ